MLKLYYAPGTCALASHIALEEAGANYEAIRLSFKDEDQKKPDYLKINPKARVPALVTDRGVLTEGHDCRLRRSQWRSPSPESARWSVAANDRGARDAGLVSGVLA